MKPLSVPSIPASSGRQRTITGRTNASSVRSTAQASVRSQSSLPPCTPPSHRSHTSIPRNRTSSQVSPILSEKEQYKQKIVLGREQPHYRRLPLDQIAGGGTCCEVGTPTLTRTTPLTYRSNRNQFVEHETFGDYNIDVYAPNPDKITTSKEMKTVKRGSLQLTTTHVKPSNDDYNKTLDIGRKEYAKRYDPDVSLRKAGSLNGWAYHSQPEYPVKYDVNNNNNNNNIEEENNKLTMEESSKINNNYNNSNRNSKSINVIKPWNIEDNNDLRHTCKDLCTTKKWTISKTSQEYPLRTVMLDPLTNNIERHDKYSKLHEDRVRHKLQDYSETYDLDGDGIVGREDLKASVAFDKQKIGVIEEEDKRKAREILVDNTIHEFGYPYIRQFKGNYKKITKHHTDEEIRDAILNTTNFTDQINEVRNQNRCFWGKGSILMQDTLITPENEYTKKQTFKMNEKGEKVRVTDYKELQELRRKENAMANQAFYDSDPRNNKNINFRSATSKWFNGPLKTPVC